MLDISLLDLNHSNRNSTLHKDSGRGFEDSQADVEIGRKFARRDDGRWAKAVMNGG